MPTQETLLTSADVLAEQTDELAKSLHAAELEKSKKPKAEEADDEEEEDDDMEEDEDEDEDDMGKSLNADNEVDATALFDRLDAMQKSIDIVCEAMVVMQKSMVVHSNPQSDQISEILTLLKSGPKVTGANPAFNPFNLRTQKTDAATTELDGVREWFNKSVYPDFKFGSKRFEWEAALDAGVIPDELIQLKNSNGGN